MAKKVKIVIVGIGGVGGYFGGLLAKKYAGKGAVEIVFVARGEHLSAIKANGLKVIRGNEAFIASPDLATDHFDETGIADYIIICTKSYGLNQTLDSLKPCIGPQTVLLPLLNGVDAYDIINRRFPENTVLKGCAFIISRLKSAGVIENSGAIQKISFGLDGPLTSEVLLLNDICRDAGIEVNCTDKISTAVWEKFIFISPTATVTSFYNKTIGEVLLHHSHEVKLLIAEIKSLALVKGISLGDDIMERTFNTMKSMKYEATSSMHRDYLGQKPETEVESLTGYIVHEAAKYGLETPIYTHFYAGLVVR
ncbi:2-dehydropantoate 2-reductase [Pedobacter sp. HDW13]|uniref:ketopantoate reductase family protein n=1 Tax=Pedobacter sp. HDW13 TaxID=2714940 RepID=UPI0014093A6B|nr:2-dehydropantoate 2-reductase [Pedobacter sp. HDW13]QIL39593.1 2-dehydropantoate 2-reductase [Pedobacter sp. HDW13]